MPKLKSIKNKIIFLFFTSILILLLNVFLIIQKVPSQSLWIICVPLCLGMAIMFDFLVYCFNKKELEKKDNVKKPFLYLINFKVWAFAILLPIAIISIYLISKVVNSLLTYTPFFMIGLIMRISTLLLLIVLLVTILYVIWRLGQEN